MGKAAARALWGAVEGSGPPVPHHVAAETPTTASAREAHPQVSIILAPHNDMTSGVPLGLGARLSV